MNIRSIKKVFIEFLDKIIEYFFANHNKHFHLHKEERSGLLVLGLEVIQLFQLALEVYLVEELNVEVD